MAECTPKKRPRDDDDDIPTPPLVKRRELPTLTDTQRKQVEALGPAKAGNCHGADHDSRVQCSICFRLKHTCGWQYRRVGPKPTRRVLQGSYCSCCVRACAKLGITRSAKQLSRVAGVLDTVRATSRCLSEFAELGDICTCTACGGKVFEKD